MTGGGPAAAGPPRSSLRVCLSLPLWLVHGDVDRRDVGERLADPAAGVAADVGREGRPGVVGAGVARVVGPAAFELLIWSKPTSATELWVSPVAVKVTELIVEPSVLNV